MLYTATFTEYPYNINSIFTFQDIPLDFILKQLGKLGTMKSTGLDCIQACMLKDAGPAIAAPLTIIMNAFLHTGILPDQWKQAKVSASKKKGPDSDPSNY